MNTTINKIASLNKISDNTDKKAISRVGIAHPTHELIIKIKLY